MRLQLLAALLLTPMPARSAQGAHLLLPARVTILYDAFGDRAGLTRDWGFAALVEYGGKRVLCDTDNNADIFAHHVQALHLDLLTLVYEAVSPRLGDHSARLAYLL